MVRWREVAAALVSQSQINQTNMNSYCVIYEFNGRQYWQSFQARNKTQARRKAKLKLVKIVSIEREYPDKPI